MVLPAATLARLATDPAAIFAPLGFAPDGWQKRLLRSAMSQVLLMASRQAGKSQVAAALALRTALLQPGSLVLLLSPSERQSGELQAKVFDLYDGLGKPVPSRKRTELQLHLVNRSRIIGLPDSEKTVRGYSGARLLVIDEAARVDDALYRTVRPMLAVSGGRLLALSTPFGQRGWFYEEWQGSEDWLRMRVPATECPRISAEYLAKEERSIGPRWFRQEFMCSFEDVVGGVFDGDALQAAFTDAVKAVPFIGATRG